MMITGQTILIESLFAAKDLSDVTVAQLQDLVDEFPSFNAAHFLLSKKMKQVNDPVYIEQAQKTALYFNNPIWLQWLLENEESGPLVFEPLKEKEELPLIMETAVNEQPFSEEPVSSFKEEVSAAPVEQGYINPAFDIIEKDEEAIPDTAYIPVEPEIQEEAQIQETSVIQEEMEPLEAETPDEPIPFQGIRFHPEPTESIIFQPYHVIDYFASQGIRLVLEDHPTDSFGKQLKSFTDWLKIMKRIPKKATDDAVDEKENERIRYFASHSLEEKDILTETMAEVLAKQGMYENAIALYRKLSLLYPPKSAYFAGRIEQLNQMMI